MILAILSSFMLQTNSGPMDEALRATEAPPTFRAAFKVELTSEKAKRVFGFDPRLPMDERWFLIEAVGEDGDLDHAASAWGAEAAPDGRLFPDDLRASLGARVSVDDLGGAWRVSFHHSPSANDTEFDVWAAERLAATAWLEPSEDRFLRIDYTLPQPVRGPEGGRLTRFNQSYLLDQDPVWNMSFIRSFTFEMEARAAFRKIQRSYSARIMEPEFFFSSQAAQDEFEASRAMGFGVRSAAR